MRRRQLPMRLRRVSDREEGGGGRGRGREGAGGEGGREQGR